MKREELDRIIREHYDALPEYLFRRYPSFSVYRHRENGKWFAVVMELDRARFDPSQTGKDVYVNLKCDPDLVDVLWEQKGIYPAYHMNKNYWVTLSLCETEEKEIRFLLSRSFALTQK